MPADGMSRIIGDRYQLLEQLAEGGMGTVYRVVDRCTGQQVALKNVKMTRAEPLDVTSDCEVLQQALAGEFWALVVLTHPNIIRVLDFGVEYSSTHDCQPYFTMELLENPQTIICGGQDKPLKVQIGLLRQMLDALGYLHERGILHNDLKPANVLIVNGQVKLLDFGLAGPIGRKRDASGTLAYMSPEVLLDQPASAASDLYAVGVIAYQMLIGQHPFDTTNASTLIDETLEKSPDLSGSLLADYPQLAQVLGCLLTKEPTHRYQSAAAVIADLETIFSRA